MKKQTVSHKSTKNSVTIFLLYTHI